MPVSNANRSIQQVVIEQAAIGQTDLVAAPGAGLAVYVVGFFIILNAAGNVTFNQGTGPTAITGVLAAGINGQIICYGNADDPVLATTANNVKLGIVTTGTGATAHGWLRYYLAPLDL